jgi:acetolactate synthase small subunit
VLPFACLHSGLTCLTLSGVETPVNLASLRFRLPGGAVENAAIRAHIEAALARRKELFALGHLAWTVDGYTVKFRLSVVDIVRTAVQVSVFEDSVRMDRMLDEVRRSFRSLSLLG